MIPTTGRSSYLRHTLQSVITQVQDDPIVQVEVVENPHPLGGSNVDEVLDSLHCPKIGRTRNTEFLGMADNWNRCVERAKGELVHILHDDDWVQPGFYAEMDSLVRRSPDHYGIFICDAAIVDDKDAVVGRIEYPGSFYQGRTTQSMLADKLYFITPATVLRRACYESVGGFSPDLRFYPDSEMWTRAAGVFGLRALNQPLACYRTYPGNTSNQLGRQGIDILEGLSLVDLYVARGYPFHRRLSSLHWREKAYQHFQHYREVADQEAAATCRDLALPPGRPFMNLLVRSRLSWLWAPYQRISYYLRHPSKVFSRLGVRNQRWI